MPSWPMVPLGEVLQPALVPEPVHPDRNYPNLGIYSFGRGVFAKPDISGAATSAKILYRVRAGQFIYSRLFAFEGAYAVVPPELDGHFVSNEFPTFDWIPGTAEPGFVRWVFKQPALWAAIAQLGVGMGDRRRRVHPESLLSFRVSLPPLEEQRRIVARLNAVAARLRARAESAERQEAELAAMLRNAFTRIATGSPRAPMAELAPLMRRPVTIDPDASYTEIGVRSFYRGIFHRRTVAGSEFTWQDLFHVEAGDVVFSNLMAWEKGIALAGEADAGCVGNHRMLTCAADRTRLIPGFLFFYFMTPEGFAQVEAASPGSIARNKTLSPDGLQAIKVPVPSLDAQQWFERLRTKADALRAQHAATAADCDALLPAMLHEIFGPCAA